jgi:hypothetical protein
MKLLLKLRDEALCPGGVSWVSIAGALGELSVGLCRGDFLLHRVCVGMLRVSDTGFRASWVCPRTNMSLCSVYHTSSLQASAV